MPQPLGYKSYGQFAPDYPEKRYTAQCPVCDRPIRESRVIPEKFEFLGGHCADFYTGIGPMLASRSVAERLMQAFPEVEIEEIELLKRGRRFTCERAVKIQPKANILKWEPESSVTISRKCDACGQFSVELILPGDFETFPDKEGELDYRVTVNDSTPGVIVKESQIKGLNAFRFCFGYLLCDDELRNLVQQRGWSNIEFLPAGKIVEN